MAYGKWMSFELLVLAAVCGCQANGPQKPFRLDSVGQPATGRAAQAGAVSATPNGKAAASGRAAGVSSVRNAPANKVAARNVPTTKGVATGAASAGAVRAVARGPETPGSVSRASHTLQQTGSKIQRAFTPEPRKVTQPDATSLAQNPGPLQPGLYVAAARMLEQRGDLQGAQAKYEQLLKADPTNLAGMVGQARIFHRRDEFDRAIEAYQRAMQTHGQDPVILNDLALCYARSGRQAEAIASLRAAVVSSPDSVLYRNNLAALLVEDNRDAEAVQVLEETHGPAIAHYNVGYLLFQRGLTDQARVHFVTALQSDPNLRAAHVMLEKTAEVSPAGAPTIAAAAVPANPPASQTAAVSPAQTQVPAAMAPVHAMPMPLAVLPASLSSQASASAGSAATEPTRPAVPATRPAMEVSHAVLQQPTASPAGSGSGEVPSDGASLAIASQDSSESAAVALAVGEGRSPDVDVAPDADGVSDVTPVDASQLVIRQPERLRAKPKTSLVAPLPR